MKNKLVSSIVVLTVICLISSLLLAVVNSFTSPVIAENDNIAVQKAMLVVMPGGSEFKKSATDGFELPSTVKEVYTESGGGYVFKLITSGYASGMSLLCGIDSYGKITGVTCLSSSETLGHEKTYGNIFRGLDITQASGVDTIAGATLTTSAYKAAVNDALTAFTVLSGKGEN